MTSSAKPDSIQAIQQWIVGKIAEAVHADPATIAMDEPMATYGIDSLAAALLSGDLSDWLGVELEPTLLWDCTTVSSLADHLWKLVLSKPTDATVG